MKVSRKWIEWAHGPAAESGVTASEKLSAMIEGPGVGSIEVTEPELLHELISVAECYATATPDPEMLCSTWVYGGEVNPARSSAKRALRSDRFSKPQLEPELEHTMPISLQQHNIPRDEWVRRFKTRVVQQLNLTSDDHSIPDAELESWPKQDEHPTDGYPAEWTTELPEAAAAENLSNWTD